MDFRITRMNGRSRGIVILNSFEFLGRNSITYGANIVVLRGGARLHVDTLKLGKIAQVYDT